MKRIVAFLIAGIMLFSNIETAVYAEEISEAVQFEDAQITAYHINPLYADVITKEDLQQSSSEDIAVPFAEPQYVSDLNVIIASIREAMAARVETVTLYYKQNADLDQSFLGEWIDLAVAETGKPNEGDYLNWHYGGASAQASRIYNPITGVRNYTINITFTYYTTAEQEEEMDAAVTSLITELGISSEFSDYKKVKIIYDYICENVSYDYDNLEDENYKLKYSAYAALVNKTAVCQGYATLLYRLLREVGVDNRVVVGTGNGGPHAWNLIKIGKKYYLADATWDSALTRYSYFLKGTQDFKYHIAESNFLSAYAISDTKYAMEFSDINENDWFYDAICYTYENDLMTGKSKTIFAPDDTLTRAEFTSVLHRTVNEPDVGYEAVFCDVSEDAWFASPVLWAYKNEVVNGYAEGEFRPDNMITREQLAVIMHNYATTQGYAVSAGGDLSAFEDAGDISSYAEEAMQWAVGAGVISGKDGVRLDPLGSATRAECAAIMQRFLAQYEN